MILTRIYLSSGFGSFSFCLGCCTREIMGFLSSFHFGIASFLFPFQRLLLGHRIGKHSWNSTLLFVLQLFVALLYLWFVCFALHLFHNSSLVFFSRCFHTVFVFFSFFFWKLVYSSSTLLAFEITHFASACIQFHKEPHRHRALHAIFCFCCCSFHSHTFDGII